jgi:hypothetical protein
MLADRVGAGRLILGAGLATVVVGLFFQPGLASGSLALVAATLCATMLVLGFNNGPLGSWLATLFPVRLRYSGVSFAFNIGGIVGGAITPIGAQMMVAGGAQGFTGLLLAAAGLITCVGVWASRPADETEGN